MNASPVWQIPPSMLRWLSAVPAGAAVAVLLRHSVREDLPPGDAGYALPITQDGVRLATDLGTLIGTRLRTLQTSPLPRCIQTAEAMRSGAAVDILIGVDRLLGDPGVYVIDDQRAAANWQERGHEGVMECLVKQEAPLPGMAAPGPAARRLLQHMLAIAGATPGLHVFVTHDSLVTSTAARILGEQLGKADWPAYLEAAFFWRDNKHVIAAYRGQRSCYVLDDTIVSGR
jgi:broad specificity phosphatase PhoE